MLFVFTASNPATFSLVAASVAYCAEQAVWLVGGVGRLLPNLLFNALAGRQPGAGDLHHARRVVEHPARGGGDHEQVVVALDDERLTRRRVAGRFRRRRRPHGRTRRRRRARGGDTERHERQ